MNYQPDWSVAIDGLPLMLQGLGVTILLTVIVLALSLVLGVPVALARMSEIGALRWATQIYIEIFRCTPLLIQIVWIFYALPALTGIALPGFAAAVIGLTLNLTAYMAEAYRSGFQAVPVEQTEAAQMLRLSRLEQIRFVIVPQALKQQLPVILSLSISSFKDTALISTIGVADLMFTSQNLALQSYRSLEVLTVAAALYFVVAFPVSVIVNALERRSPGSRGPGRRGLRALAALRTRSEVAA
jgi:polar amino acid transport system permease protein